MGRVWLEAVFVVRLLAVENMRFMEKALEQLVALGYAAFTKRSD